MISNNIQKKLRGLTWIFYDFDGVMTDNRVMVFSSGEEAVVCHRGDGWAVGRFKQHGLNQCIITTEINNVVKRRAKKLGLPCLVSSNKADTLRDYARAHQVNLASSAYLGNDQNDWKAMQLVGLTAAPVDAWSKLKRNSDIVIPVRGGDGVVREFLEIYEKALGRNSFLK